MTIKVHCYLHKQRQKHRRDKKEIKKCKQIFYLFAQRKIIFTFSALITQNYFHIQTVIISNITNKTNIVFISFLPCHNKQVRTRGHSVSRVGLYIVLSKGVERQIATPSVYSLGVRVLTTVRPGVLRGSGFGFVFLCSDMITGRKCQLIRRFHNKSKVADIVMTTIKRQQFLKILNKILICWVTSL